MYNQDVSEAVYSAFGQTFVEALDLFLAHSALENNSSKVSVFTDQHSDTIDKGHEARPRFVNRTLQLDAVHGCVLRSDLT